MWIGSRVVILKWFNIRIVIFVWYFTSASMTLTAITISWTVVSKNYSLIHSLRRFFNTALMNSDVAYSFKELIDGP